MDAAGSWHWHGTSFFQLIFLNMVAWSCIIKYSKLLKNQLLLCSVASSGPVKWSECLHLWQLEKIGPEEACLIAVLSYDRIKSVYKYAELQKAGENFCVSLRSVRVFTCIKPLASSKILNEVNVKMWHRASWCFVKKALKSVICPEASVERSLITLSFPVLVHPSAFILFPSLTATAILVASSVYIELLSS